MLLITLSINLSILNSFSRISCVYLLAISPLNSVSNGQYINCKEQHTTSQDKLSSSQDQLTSSHDPFIIVVHEDSLVTLNPQNCYWLFTNTPFPTSSRLLSHALPSSPVSSCDELLGLCAEKLDKLGSVLFLIIGYVDWLKNLNNQRILLDFGH